MEDHLNIVLSGAAAGKPGAAGLDGVRFEHVALPEIDPFPQFLGYDLSAPLMVSSTTGGVGRASQISADLAQAAGALAVALTSAEAVITHSRA